MFMNTSVIKTAQDKIDLYWRIMLAFSLAVAINMLPDMALAAGGDASLGSIGSILCTIVQALTGQVGRAIGTIAIITVGIGALMGKISWGLALIVAMGVAIVFG